MKLLSPQQAKVESHAWGSLTWYASKGLGNSDFATAGICRIKKNAENPRHLHPNCQEILHVLEGDIVHSYGEGPDSAVSMGKGSTITVPPGIFHNARNVGDCEAVLLITFSCAERQTVGE
jgi:quercetin dioxygenase-like cupin family protein